jgi:hypothetical protein
MSDVLPKMKLYIFISFLNLFIGLGVFCLKNSLDIGQFLLSTSTAFVPFISLVNLAFVNAPVEIMLMIGLVTGIMSGIQVFILTMVIMQISSNLLWHPDV